MLIAIDHGNKLIKIPNHEPFTSGLEESDVPPFAGETLKYQGKYYTLSEKRIPYHRDKTEDERFFILSLFAIAYEIEAADGYSQNVMRIQLAVGLSPAHYGAQHEAFTSYFTGRGVVRFEYQKRPYSIYIEKAMCFPQSYAAAVTILKSLRDKPKALIVDQGGMTTDFLLLKDGVGDLSVCDSLEHGVITLYNMERRSNEAIRSFQTNCLETERAQFAPTRYSVFSFVPEHHSGKGSRSPLMISGAGMSFVGRGVLSCRWAAETNSQSFSLSFSRLSRVTPSFLVYSSSSKKPDTHSKLPFLTPASMSYRVMLPHAHT